MKKNPTAFTKFTAGYRSYNLYYLVVAKTVIMIPITQIAAVFVTFNRDLVRASNILVMLTPPKLNTAIVSIPENARNIRNPFSNTSLKYTLGNSIKGLLLSSKTQPFTSKWQGIKDKMVKKMVIKPIPKIPSNPTISKG